MDYADGKLKDLDYDEGELAKSISALPAAQVAA